MSLRSLISTFVLVGGVAMSSQAQVTEFSFTNDDTALAGFVVNQAFVSFDGQLTDAQVLTSGLEAGDIYQETTFSGSDTAPSSALADAFATVASDTFVHFGADRSNGTGAITPSFAGGSVDIGGEAGLTFGTSLLDAAYFIPGGSSAVDESSYFIGQFTFASTANGSITLFANAAGEGSSVTYDIVNGVVAVPEPATACLLALGGVAMISRRRVRA